LQCPGPVLECRNFTGIGSIHRKKAGIPEFGYIV